MKIIYYIIITLISMACTTSKNKGNGAFIPTEIDTTNKHLTPELMWRLGRVGEPHVSPNNQYIVFTITYTDIAEDKSYADIYIMPTTGGTPQRLTWTKENEYQVGWRPDGKKITFLSTKSKDAQLWEMNIDGSEPKQITNIEGGIESYLYSPDIKHIAYTQRVKLDKTINDIYPDLPKANARIETDLMYRHWNEWADFKYSHIFIAKYTKNEAITNAIDIMEGERFHSPLMPFGGIEQIAWTSDGMSLAYTCKKLAGKASALSTNSDIYLYNIADKSTSNMTAPNKGYDINPAFSKDGKRMFWLSMEHDGYESDKNRLMMMDLSTKTRYDLTENIDITVITYCISNDCKKAWFIANIKGCDEVFEIDIDTKTTKQITTDRADYQDIVECNNILIARRMSMNMPSEIFCILKGNGTATNLSKINTSTLEHIDFGDIEERWITTSDNKQMHTWVIYPPKFDKTKKYPALLYCQGGPQSTVSQFWSLRWNMQLMAANGYIVVAPNRRGLPGFGREWNEQISGDYGGQCMQDYLSAIDTLSSEPYVDSENIGAVGASFGGYSIYWLAGNHNKRFKAFIAHCGIFNFDIMNVTTEELFFEEWDMKGMFWEYDNKAAMKSFSQSPHLFVNNWDTPIMVIHGEKDFRIPYTQGMAAFNTAIMKDIPAEFLYFPDECHWVMKPQNSILWHREFYKWLDKWLK